MKAKPTIQTIYSVGYQPVLNATSRVKNTRKEAINDSNHQKYIALLNNKDLG
jgi:hypothetical protein